MQSHVKYAKRLTPGNVIVKRDGEDVVLLKVEKIQTARGRKPRRGGDTLLVHTADGILRVNTKDPVRVLAGASADS